MTDVFISYKRENRLEAKTIAEVLAAQGYEVWWDYLLLAGQDFTVEINTVIKRTKAMVVLWTPNAIDSGWVLGEATSGFNRKILVPAILQKVEEIPVPFNTLHTLDLTSWNKSSDSLPLNDLLASIERLTGKLKKSDLSKNEYETNLSKPYKETKTWNKIRTETPNSIEKYKEYLDEYGTNANFSDLAETKIEELSLSRDGKFILSGESSEIEDYRYFIDSSNLELVTANELEKLKKENNWTEENNRRWLYFYTPSYDFPDNITAKQKELINKHNEEINQDKFNITANNFFIFVVFAISTILLINKPSVLFSKYSLILIVSFIILTIRKKQHYNSILLHKEKIQQLKREINFLFQQHEKISKNIPTGDEANRAFWWDIKNIELKFIKKIGNTIDEKFIAKVRNAYGDFGISNNLESPITPIIINWALPQLVYTNNIKMGKTHHQDIKINLSYEEIVNKISSWRPINGQSIIFRLWHIQFLFFQKDNLTIASLYYDFVTQKTYNEKIETFQYNHITNYSYKNENIAYMRDDPFIKSLILSEQLPKNIFKIDTKTFHLASASGTHHECVIPTTEMMKELNLWLNYRSKEEGIQERYETREGSNYIQKLIENLAWLSFKELQHKVRIYEHT